MKIVKTKLMSYLLPTVDEKDDSVMIDERIFFSQHVKNYLRTYENIQINTTGQGDKKRIGCLLDYPCLKKIL